MENHGCIEWTPIYQYKNKLCRNKSKINTWWKLVPIVHVVDREITNNR